MVTLVIVIIEKQSASFRHQEHDSMLQSKRGIDMALYKKKHNGGNGNNGGNGKGGNAKGGNGKGGNGGGNGLG
jgi:hypothetical protein